MRVPFSFLTEQFANPEPILAHLREFLRRCDFTLGEEVTEFEKRYASYCGAKFAVGVGSGTDALFLGLKIAGVQPGDEVITAPNSFIATTGAIVQAGGRPVYVDVQPNMNLSAEAIEPAITEKTRAILPVHWAGVPADMEKIMEVSRRRGIPVVEDCCQALGARVGDRHVGTFGVVGAFSVHPLKPLHVWGDGGILVTNSEDAARRLRLLRNHGLDGRDTVATYGYNTRLDNVQAIVGLHVMETLDETISKRVIAAQRYDEAFSQKRFSGLLEVPPRDSRLHSVVHLYMIYSKERDRLLKHLTSKGIEAKVHYPTPLHLQPAAKLWGHEEGSFPQTERQSRESITLPCHQYLTSEHLNFVIDEVASFYGV